jgi:hypothetical protein
MIKRFPIIINGDPFPDFFDFRTQKDDEGIGLLELCSDVIEFSDRL